MAYNEELAEHVRKALSFLKHVEEKKMFGGIAFMVNGKMCITIGEKQIMCRIDPALHAASIQKKGCSTMIMKGRQYIGYVRVTEEALKTKKDFEHWIALSLDYNERAKASKKKK